MWTQCYHTYQLCMKAYFCLLCLLVYQFSVKKKIINLCHLCAKNKRWQNDQNDKQDMKDGKEARTAEENDERKHSIREKQHKSKR